MVTSFTGQFKPMTMRAVKTILIHFLTITRFDQSDKTKIFTNKFEKVLSTFIVLEVFGMCT